MLNELNCEWEWSVGNITIQTASMEGEPLLSKVERIVDRLSQELQQAGASWKGPGSERDSNLSSKKCPWNRRCEALCRIGKVPSFRENGPVGDLEWASHLRRSLEVIAKVCANIAKLTNPLRWRTQL